MLVLRQLPGLRFQRFTFGSNGSIGLQHLPFFEAVGREEEKSPRALMATAGLLAIRLVDFWKRIGPVIVDGDSASVRSVRASAMALSTENPQRKALLALVKTIELLNDSNN